MSELDLREALCAGSDRELDASMHPLIRAWDPEPTSLQILEVLDHCIHGSLASGFVVSFLQAIYEVACKREGKTHEDNVPYAKWRERT